MNVIVSQFLQSRDKDLFAEDYSQQFDFRLEPERDDKAAYPNSLFVMVPAFSKVYVSCSTK